MTTMTSSPTIRAALVTLLVAFSAVCITVNCGGEFCDLEEGCVKYCEQDEDCEGRGKDGEALVCREIPGGELEPFTKACTRPCTRQADCGLVSCACSDSPDQGWCSLGAAPKATCRNDASVSDMCDSLTNDLYFHCGCYVVGIDLDNCARYTDMFPNCQDHLLDFFLCGYRLTTDAVCSSLDVTEVCGAKLTALEACTATSWALYQASQCTQ